MKSVYMSLLLAWFTAFVSSMPQLFVYTAVEIMEDTGWFQCTTMWQAATLPNYKASIDIPGYLCEVFHLLFIFWIPFSIITACYAVIAVKLSRLSNTTYITVTTPVNSTSE